VNRIVKAAALFSVVTTTMPVFIVGLEGCSSSSKSKGGITPPPSGTKLAGAKPDAEPKPDGGRARAFPRAGVTTRSLQPHAIDTGSAYGEVTCDAETEGDAWCTDDTRITFCSHGHFYKLDCSDIGNHNVCAEESDRTSIDCWPVEETE